jgi:hypothetical protein
MTSRISIFIGIAVTALAFGVPTALGEGRLAGSPELSVSTQPTAVSRPDSHDIVRPVSNGYIDASDRARRINTVVPTAYLDAFERAAPPKGSQPVSVDATGSGNELEWPQLGIGFGLGLLLAGGLLLAMRMTKIRPLAH